MRRAILKHRIAAVGAGRLNPMDYVHDLVKQTKFRNVITGTGYICGKTREWLGLDGNDAM